jgi:DNA-binding Lrp family transcriptional regulator
MKRKRVETAIFVMTCDESSTVEEAAKKMGIRPNTVQQRIYRLRKKYPGIFRKTLKRERKGGNPLDELAKLRNITFEELNKEMLERVQKT